LRVHAIEEIRDRYRSAVVRLEGIAIRNVRSRSGDDDEEAIDKTISLYLTASVDPVMLGFGICT